MLPTPMGSQSRMKSSRTRRRFSRDRYLSRPFVMTSILAESYRHGAKRPEVSEVGLARLGRQHARERAGADHLIRLQADTGAGEFVGEPCQRHQGMVERGGGGALAANLAVAG